MADSVREQILAALHTKLQTITTGGVRFDRSRIVPRTDSDGTVVGNIRPGTQPYKESISNPKGHYQEERTLPVDVRVIAYGTIPDKVADPVCVEVSKVMTADQRLDGLILSIHEVDRHWLFADPERKSDFVEVAMIFQVRYLTRRGDETTTH